MGTAEVPLSKVQNLTARGVPLRGSPITLTSPPQLHVCGSCVCMFVFRAYVFVKLYNGMEWNENINLLHGIKKVILLVSIKFSTLFFIV